MGVSKIVDLLLHRRKSEKSILCDLEPSLTLLQPLNSLGALPSVIKPFWWRRLSFTPWSLTWAPDHTIILIMKCYPI